MSAKILDLECVVCGSKFIAYEGATVCSLSCARRKRGVIERKPSKARSVSEKVRNHPAYLARRTK